MALVVKNQNLKNRKENITSTLYLHSTWQFLKCFCIQYSHLALTINQWSKEGRYYELLSFFIKNKKRKHMVFKWQNYTANKAAEGLECRSSISHSSVIPTISYCLHKELQNLNINSSLSLNKIIVFFLYSTYFS